MFDHTTPEIDAFRDMFAETDRSPILMDSETIFAEPISNDDEIADRAAFISLSLCFFGWENIRFFNAKT